MIQIRNVPEALYRRLKSRAALAGVSLSDYLLAELGRMPEWPAATPGSSWYSPGIADRYKGRGR